MRTVTARITMLRSKDGGRKAPISALRDFSCPILFRNAPQLSDHGYDCRILVRQFGRDIAPGDTIDEIEVAFLSPDEVFPYLREGMQFDIWESGIIGNGTIMRI